LVAAAYGYAGWQGLISLKSFISAVIDAAGETGIGGIDTDAQAAADALLGLGMAFLAAIIRRSGDQEKVVSSERPPSEPPPPVKKPPPVAKGWKDYPSTATNTSEGSRAAGQGTPSLYDTSITSPGSQYLNVQTNVGAQEFQSNLLANGYNIVKQTDGATILTNGTSTYTIYTRTSTGLPGAQFFGGDGSIVKFSLGGP
jgi:hypothetical protein